MKPLFSISISLTGAIALSIVPLGQIAFAQVSNTTLTAPIYTHSELLNTEPASLSTPGYTTARQVPSLSTATLKSVADSFQRKPQATGQILGLPTNLIPKDFFRTPPKPVHEFNPLEPFQVPPLDSGISINLNHF